MIPTNASKAIAMEAQQLKPHPPVDKLPPSSKNHHHKPPTHQNAAQHPSQPKKKKQHHPTNHNAGNSKLHAVAKEKAKQWINVSDLRSDGDETSS